MKTNDKNSKKRAAPPRYDEAFRAGAVRKLSLGKAFTLDPMGRLPSTRQWVLVSAPRRSLLLRLCRKGRHRRPTPLDPNRGLYPCTQHT